MKKKKCNKNWAKFEKQKVKIKKIINKSVVSSSLKSLLSKTYQMHDHNLQF